MKNKNIVLYNDGEIELNVSINDETTWLNRNQISQLLNRDVKTIGKHINNVLMKTNWRKIQLSQILRQLQKMEKNMM